MARVAAGWGKYGARMADIGMSLADVPALARPSEARSRAKRETPLRSDLQCSMPIELNLGDPVSIASLREINIGWPRLSFDRRSHWLQNLRVALPIRPVPVGDIALLPGGIVAVRHPNGILLCDPLEAVALRGTEAGQVRRALAGRLGVVTLLHMEDGVILQSQIPETLPPQSASIVLDASMLPGQAACAGPAVIQWYATGATVWPLVPAPPSLALAASVAAAPVAENAPPVSPEFWDAADVNTRLHLLATGLVEYLSELLAADLSDDLRFALSELCVGGSDSLASRLADALGAVPACFLGDPSVLPGEPSASWSTGVALLRRARRPLAFVGLETCCEPRRAVTALREAIQDPTATIFHETGDGQRGVTAALGSDAAVFVARWCGRGGRIGVLLEPRESPLGLYTIAASLAQEVGGTVVAAAPCWGFCHRIAGEGGEAGNAAWFGMGAGLDELDMLVSDVAGTC
jgi:hypothetical protein